METSTSSAVAALQARLAVLTAKTPMQVQAHGLTTPLQPAVASPWTTTAIRPATAVAMAVAPQSQPQTQHQASSYELSLYRERPLTAYSRTPGPAPAPAPAPMPAAPATIASLPISRGLSRPRSASATRTGVQRSASGKKKRTQLPQTQPAWPLGIAATASSSSLVAPPLPRAVPGEGHPSILSALTRDLACAANSVPSCSSVGARDLLAPSVVGKLQSILSTAWLGDSGSLARSEELLLSRRYYTTWRDAGTIARHPAFRATDAPPLQQQAMAQWTGLLAEGLFISVAPATVSGSGSAGSPPATGGWDTSDFAPTPSAHTSLPAPTSCLRFGSRVVSAFLDPGAGSDDQSSSSVAHGPASGSSLHVRVGGGYVEVLEFARAYSAIEGRKAASLLGRDELICLALLLQERLLASVVRRHQAHQQAEIALQRLRNDADYEGLERLASRWRTAEARMADQLRRARVQLAQQQLHWKWTRTDRVRDFDTEAEARAALAQEEQLEEQRVKAEDDLASQQRAVEALAASASADDDTTSSGDTGGPIAALGQAMASSYLPLDLAAFAASLSAALSDLSSQYSTLGAQLAQAKEQVAEARTREAAALANVAEGAQQLAAKDLALVATQQDARELTARVRAGDRAAQQAADQATQQSEAWTRKLGALLAELKSKSSADEAQRRRDQELHDQQVGALRDQLAEVSRQLDEARERPLKEAEVAEARLAQQHALYEHERAELITRLQGARDETSSLRESLATTRGDQAVANHMARANEQREEHRRQQAELEAQRSRERESSLRQEAQHEAQRLRERTSELECLLRAEQDARRVEREQLKSDLVQAVRAATATTSHPNDTTFDLAIEDIVTQLPHHSSTTQQSFIQPHLQHQQPRSPGQTTRTGLGISSPLPPRGDSSLVSASSLQPSSSGSFVPLALFSRLHTRLRQATLEHASSLEALQRDASSRQELATALSHDRATAHEHALRLAQDQIAQQRHEADERFARSAQALALAQDQVVQQRHEAEERLTRAANATESKVAEIAAIYAQMLDLKTNELQEAVQKCETLQMQLDTPPIAAASPMKYLEQGMLQLSLKTPIKSKQQLPCHSAPSSQSNESLRPVLLRALSELRTLQAAHHALRVHFTQLASGGIDTDAVRSSLTTHFSSQVKLLDSYRRKYMQELSERRKYFDQVQELRGNIRVFVRIRPSLPGQLLTTSDEPPSPSPTGSHLQLASDPLAQAVFTSSDDPCALNLLYAPGSTGGPGSRGATMLPFEFDRVFQPEDTQDTVFKHVEHMCTSLMDGFNCCVCMYGQTGSGKTHTTLGSASDPGVAYRVLREVFRLRSERAHGFIYTVSLSLCEIKNDSIFDLLAPASSRATEHKISDAGGAVTLVPALVERACEDEASLKAALAHGQRARATEATACNAASSRSHMLVVLKIQAQDRHSSKAFTSRMHLVDLAGSERLKKSQSEGERKIEAASINRSLSALGNVLQVLQTADATHVPFRANPLTHMLKSSLGGPSKTLMIVTVSPNAGDLGETFCSLQFGSRARKVEMTPQASAQAQLASGSGSQPSSPHPGGSSSTTTPASPTPRGGRVQRRPSAIATSAAAAAQRAAFAFANGLEGLDDLEAAQIRPELARSGSLSGVASPTSPAVRRASVGFALGGSPTLTRSTSLGVGSPTTPRRSSMSVGPTSPHSGNQSGTSSANGASVAAAIAAQAAKLRAAQTLATELQTKLQASVAREEALQQQAVQLQEQTTQLQQQTTELQQQTTKLKLEAAKKPTPLSPATSASKPKVKRRALIVEMASTACQTLAMVDSAPPQAQASTSTTPITSKSPHTTPRRGRSPIKPTAAAVAAAAAAQAHAVATATASAVATHVANISQLTTLVAGLKVELLGKAKIEDELKTTKEEFAEKEARFLERQARWRAKEERRKVGEALVAKMKASVRDAELEEGALVPIRLDVHQPDSVAITRLTGDVHQLQHTLRVRDKQQSVVEAFLAERGLPTVEQLWRDRPRKGAAQMSQLPSFAAKQQDTIVSPMLARTMPASFYASTTETVPSSAVLESPPSNSAVRSRSEERISEVQPPSAMINDESAALSSSALRSSSSPPQSPTNRPPSSVPTSAEPRRSYVPHRTPPVFKPLVVVSDVPPRRPRVPILSKSFAPVVKSDPSSSTTKSSSIPSSSPTKQPKSSPTKQPVTPSRIPRARTTKSLTSSTPVVVQSEPIVIRRKSAIPTISTSTPAQASKEAEPTTTLSTDQPLVELNSPTSASISRGLELSEQILSSPPAAAVIVPKSSAPVELSAVPKMRGGGGKKVEASAASTSVPTLQAEPESVLPVTTPASISLPEPTPAPTVAPVPLVATPVAPAPVPVPSVNPFAGISFAQIAAEASAAVFSASPTAAPFLVAASVAPATSPLAASPVLASVPAPVPEVLALPEVEPVAIVSPPATAAAAVSPTSPSSGPPKFVGESSVVAALSELKWRFGDDGQEEGPDHAILLVVTAQPSEIAAAHPEGCQTNKKVVVYSKGMGAFTPRFDAMYLGASDAYYLVLRVEDEAPVDPDAPPPPRFVVVEWMGEQTEDEEARELQSFSPVLQRFIAKHLKVDLFSQASHPSQVTLAAIREDLDAATERPTRSSSSTKTNGHHHRRGSEASDVSAASDDSDGSFVDLNAQLAAEAESTEVDTTVAAASTVEPLRSEPSLTDRLAAFLAESQQHRLREQQEAALVARSIAEVDESDIVHAHELEAELRARNLSRMQATPRKRDPSSSPRASFSLPAASPKSALKTSSSSASAGGNGHGEHRNVSFASELI